MTLEAPLAASGVVRAALGFVFVYFTIAAAHLLMVAVNTLDERFSALRYQSDGVEARWLGDAPLAEEIDALRRRGGAVAAARTSQPLRMLPVSPFLVGAAAGLILSGFALLLISRRVRSDALQTIMGVFAGLSIWTGGVEYGLVIASRSLGIAKSVAPYDGRIVGCFGEYVLLKHTWGILVVVCAYLLFLESNRCPVFVWFRRRLPLMRGAVACGRVENYAPRVAFEYVTITWTFYVLLLWAYDPLVFGVRGMLTHALFFGSFGVTGWLVVKLCRQRGHGPALRYAIGVGIVAWTPVEIAAKWRLFEQPWCLLQPTTALAFFGGTALSTGLVVREVRRSRRKPQMATALRALALAAEA
ncbi:MAG: hypothetical protein IT449_16895 [Phycisphaerales bacterium]|nr:hypothetical protein [Phycisphaerales bacterium]